VHACISATGTLSADSTIAPSSGHPRLDEATLRLVRAGTGKYVNSTVTGEAVNDCFVFPVELAGRL
jgi:hypothetical protein